MVNIEGLKEYAQSYPEVLGKLFNQGTVLSLLTPHTGANAGKYRLRLYEADGTFSDCCTVPKGKSALKEVETEVACFLSGNEFCDADLGKALGDAKLRYTAGSENAGSLEELFMEQELKAVAKNIDKIVFQGDMASEDTNINKFDGILKQVSDAKTVAMTSGTAIEKIQALLAGLDEEADDMGTIGVFVPVALGRQLKSELISQNLFHYDLGESKGTDSFVMPGFSNVMIIPSRGLNKTDKAIVTPLSNLHWITNLEGDHMNMDWDYEKYHQVYYWRVKFILGVAVGIVDYVTVGTLA